MVDNKTTILSDLQACKKAFDKAEVPWSITDGLVLGYGRYKDVMTWDTDVDIGIFVEVSEEKWRTLHNCMREQGFNLPYNMTDFMHCNRAGEFGMGMFHKNGDFYEQFPESTPGLKFVEKASWHDNPQMVEFMNDTYPIPNNIDDYLDCRYGEGWLTNIVTDAEAFFVEKRGGRDQATWTKGRCSKHGDLWPKIIRTDENMSDFI